MNQVRVSEISDQQFEDLAVSVCMRVLGTGTFCFSKGKDGGRDGRFEGTAAKFPSSASPLSGKFIIQAKHTSNPVASCSDGAFAQVMKEELPRIEKLLIDGELDHYLLFTNRKVSATREKKFREDLKTSIGLVSSYLIGIEQLINYLKLDNSIWRSLGLPIHDSPLIISPKDMGEVILSFYDSIGLIEQAFNSDNNFEYPGIKKKNRLNGLSTEYYEAMKANSIPYFGAIDDFLGNPRNVILREKYAATANEIKFRAIQKRKDFDTFDSVLDHIYQIIVEGNENLGHRGRLAYVFLHYMYCHCEIGLK